jgi:ABC-type branched-subunit amino acid transport system substrate-binding protein
MKALLLACALLLLTGAGPAAALENSILLGMNYPLTGPYSVEGLDQIRAARLAVDEINAAGGIMGRRAVLVPRDSASDTLRTKLNVRELIEAGCSMVFGGASSAVAIAAAEVCHKYQTPFFGTLTYSTETTLERGHRVVFRECNDSWMSAQVMAGWLNQNFANRRFVYVTADYTWGWTTEESLRRVTDTRDRERHQGFLTPLGTTDFTGVLQQVAAEPPEVLVLALFGKDLAYALRQAHDMGLKEHCQIVVPNLTLGMAERAGAEAMAGVVGTLPWTWTVPSLFNYPRGQAFVDAFVRRYHRYPSTSGASAYTIVYEYKAAVERARSFRTADVVKALEGHTYILLKDAQTWRALDHQSVQTVYMVRGNDMETVLADPLRLNFFSVIERKAGTEIVRSPEEWMHLRAQAGLPPHLEALEE